MTRIEKIRQMTDEELAEFLSKFAPGACVWMSCPDPHTLAKGADRCTECFLRWLRDEGPLMDGEGV